MSGAPPDPSNTNACAPSPRPALFPLELLGTDDDDDDDDDDEVVDDDDVVDDDGVDEVSISIVALPVPPGNTYEYDEFLLLSVGVVVLVAAGGSDWKENEYDVDVEETVSATFGPSLFSVDDGLDVDVDSAVVVDEALFGVDGLAEDVALAAAGGTLEVGELKVDT